MSSTAKATIVVVIGLYLLMLAILSMLGSAI
jgi:hypothetical protein